MELLDIYDESGNYLGTEDRKIVHRDALWHKTVHCWLYDKNSNVYFQIRTKEGTLYTTASGHLAAGETVKEAFGREIFEELGLKIDYEKSEKINVVKFIMDRKEKDGSIFRDRAFANVYMYEFNGMATEFNFDLNEVQGLIKMNAQDVLDILNNKKEVIKGISIRNIDGKIEENEEDIIFSDFLINKGETGIEKYGHILEEIIAKTNK